MKNSQTILIVAIAVVATLSIAAIAGITIKDITAEETEKKGYNFAENVMITAVLKFKDGTELVNFEAYSMKSGFIQPRTTPSLELMKVVGDTPLLHKAVDDSRRFDISQGGMNFQNRYFDIELILSQNGKAIREYHYQDCSISGFKTVTEFDKEEGWLGKMGFAVVESYELTCEGLQPQNPSYEQMNNIPKAKTPSTMDIKETQQWTDIYKYFK